MVAAIAGLPIMSQDQVREYALGCVVRGYRVVNATSMELQPGEKSWVEVYGDNAEEILDQLLKSPIKYTLGNPGDVIRGNIWLYDKYGNAIFYGGAEYSAAEASGKAGGPTYAISLNRAVITFEKKATSAEVLVLDEKGKTIRAIPLDVDDYGNVLFNPWFAGVPNGILSVKFDDGTIVTTRLSYPYEDISERVNEEISDWAIEGHYVSRSPKNVVYIDIVETQNLPTIFIEAVAGQKVVINVQGLVQADGQPFLERPLNFAYIGENESGSGMMPSDGPITLQFDTAGKYRVRFTDWPNFMKPGYLYMGPYEDGMGKGSVENPVQ